MSLFEPLAATSRVVNGPVVLTKPKLGLSFPFIFLRAEKVCTIKAKAVGN